MPKRAVSQIVSPAQGLMSEPIDEIKAELFKALAHPARIRILEVLSDGERSVGELQPLVRIESSHLSQQLAVLRHAQLVSARREGTSVFYAVKDKTTVKLLQVAKTLLINTLSERSQLLDDLRGAVQ